jgi:hypothetical protein
MSENQETPHKLKPKDNLSKIPNPIAFILYRIYPIGSLSYILYETHAELVLNWYQFIRLWFIFILVILLFLSGIWYGREYGYSKLEESGSRQAWLDTLNSNFEKWGKSGDPIAGLWCSSSPELSKQCIQIEKEAFSAYLAGSGKGLPLPYNLRESWYHTAFIFGHLYGVIRVASLDEDELPISLRIMLWIGIFLYIFSFLFFFGRWLW